MLTQTQLYNRISFNGYQTFAEVQTIRNEIWNIYLTSNGQSLIDTWLNANPNANIVFNYQPRAAEVQSQLPGNIFYDINFTSIYIDSNGVARQHIPLDVIAHELGHALTLGPAVRALGVEELVDTDWENFNDFSGSNVTATNPDFIRVGAAVTVVFHWANSNYSTSYRTRLFSW